LTLSKKEIREIVGLTFSELSSNPKGWYDRACSFKAAAQLLAKNEGGTLAIPYNLSTGLSLELLLKAIALVKGKSFNTSHCLNDLCRNADVTITDDQKCTLELLSEVIVWSGRYPAPKRQEQWDNYHDSVFEKHVIREKVGNTGKVIAHKGRFPTLENYLKIWQLFENEFRNVFNNPA